MTDVEVRNLEMPFGAEVTGLDVTRELEEPARHRLRHALDERGLLVFRGLDIDQTYQGYLAETVIGLDPGWESIRSANPGTRAHEADAFYVSNRRAGATSKFGRLKFHSDTMWADDPLKVVSLYAVEVETPVVPTMFASATLGWFTLPKDLRNRIAGLSAVHQAGQIREDEEKDGDVVVSIPAVPKSTTKPIGNRHPRTGETILYINEQMTHEVVGLSPEESRSLLKALFVHLYRQDNVLHHEWQTGDLVVWDNMAVQHGRPNVKETGPVRTLRRFVSPLELIQGQDRIFNYEPVTVR